MRKRDEKYALAHCKHNSEQPGVNVMSREAQFRAGNGSGRYGMPVVDDARWTFVGERLE